MKKCTRTFSIAIEFIIYQMKKNQVIIWNNFKRKIQGPLKSQIGVPIHSRGLAERNNVRVDTESYHELGKWRLGTVCVGQQ